MKRRRTYIAPLPHPALVLVVLSVWAVVLAEVAFVQLGGMS